MTKLALLAVLVSAVVSLGAMNPGCACAPSQQCELVRALCGIDVCIKADPGGWRRCQGLSEDCNVESSCLTRSECTRQLIDTCAARMTPGAAGYEAYARCRSLDCSSSSPPPPAPPDAAPASPDAGAACAGVLCNGACCTGYPCFSGKRCRCLPSVADCSVPDAGEGAAPITPSCCSDAPLCSAQGKRCCFLPESSGLPAQVRCLTQCSSERRHCTFAPYLQSDQASSCLPPPYDTAGLLCPF